MKSNSVQFFGGHLVFKVDLHFATCGAIDILRPLSVLKCVQSNEIVPYNEDLNLVVRTI
jgi:hypothetical protein